MRISQIAQDVLEQTEMIYQNVRKKAMQAYVKYKAYYEKKANASKMKEKDYVHFLQPTADHQGSKMFLTEFGGLRLTLCKRPYQITII